MSENDFQSINQNQYRGSRYSSFVGGGTDSAGNVTAAGSENSANTVASSDPTLPQNQNVDVNKSILGNANIPNPVISGSSAKVVTGGIQAVGPTVGARIGLNLALGKGIENSLSGIGSDIAGRVSSGLLGSSASVTSPSAISSLTSKLGGASGTAAGNLSNNLSGASKSIGIGSAAGSGLAAAATTLLTGGSVKDAAFTGGGAYLGSLAGTAAGAAIGGTIGSVVPVVGTIIGSWLGSKLGGLFGGDKDYPYGIAKIGVNDGKSSVYFTDTLDGFKNTDVQALGDATSSVIQKFVDATGSKNIEGSATIGYLNARKSSHKLNQSGFFAGGHGSFNGGATYQGLKDSKSAIESSVKDWLQTAKFNDAPDKQSIIQSGLTNNMSLDDIYNSLTGTYNAPTIVKPRQATFYS